MEEKQVYLFGCVEKNIGDDLFIYAVCKRYPNVNFIITYEANYLNINNIPNLFYNKNLTKWLRFANKESDNIISRNINAIFEKIYRLKLKKLDSVYIVGNAFKNMNYKGKYQLKWLERRIAMSNNFFLISTNYGPTNNDNWQKDCYTIFSEMTDVCFRDTYSYKLFSDLKNVRYAPDAVLSLDIQPIKNDKNSKLSLKEYVIISVIDCMMEERSEKLKKTATSYEDKMISLINSFNEDNIEVIILNSNTIQDGPASQRIFNKCIYKNMVSIFNYDGNLEDIFSLFSNAKAIIATRLHTIILGWLYKLPVIPVIYDIKVENLLKSYKFSGLKKHISDLNDLNYEEIKSSISNYSYVLPENIINDSNNQFKQIDKLLKKEDI